MTPTPAQAASAASDRPPHPLELVRELVATFGPDFDAEEEVSGADAVEWMCDFVNRARISAGFWRSRERAYLAAIQAFHAAAANYSRGGDGRAVRAVERLDASVRERLGAPLLPRPARLQRLAQLICSIASSPRSALRWTRVTRSTGAIPSNGWVSSSRLRAWSSGATRTRF